jgi:hypothetical protein
MIDSLSTTRDPGLAGAAANRTLVIVLWMSLAAGSLFALINVDLPVTRNALTFAKATLGIIQNGFNPLLVVHDSSWTSGKPILFPMVAAPFTWFFGANTGTIVASSLGAALFLWSVALVLPRLNQRAGGDSKLVPLAFVFVALNPLVLYQFWSGYPDGLVAGLMLLALHLTDIIASEPERDTRWHIIGLGAVIYAAMHVKLYGAILGLTCPIYLLIHARPLLTRSSHRASKIAIMGVVFGFLAFVALLAKLDVNPLLDLAAEEPLGGGFAGYIRGLFVLTSAIHLAVLKHIAFALVINFHIALLFLSRRSAWRAFGFAPTVWIMIYMLGLFPFPGTRYNMRYFLPAFPFLAIVLVAGAASIRPQARRVILGGYALLAIALVLTFNWETAHREFRPFIDRALAPFGGDRNLDNLRIRAQLDVKRQITFINERVQPGQTLYWASNYYRTATHGLATHLGVRKDLDVRYVRSIKEAPPSEGPVFAFAFMTSRPGRLAQPPAWATVHSMGYGLFRLDPIPVEQRPSARGNF